MGRIIGLVGTYLRGFAPPPSDSLTPARIGQQAFQADRC